MLLVAILLPFALMFFSFFADFRHHCTFLHFPSPDGEQSEAAKLVINLLIVLFPAPFPPPQWFSRLLTFFLAISFALTLILCFAFLVTLQNVVFPRFNWLLTVRSSFPPLSFCPSNLPIPPSFFLFTGAHIHVHRLGQPADHCPAAHNLHL